MKQRIQVNKFNKCRYPTLSFTKPSFAWKVKEVDIHYLNIKLLSLYLLPYGSIKPRYQTQHSPYFYKKIVKHIKIAKKLGLMPYVNYKHRLAHFLSNVKK